MEKQFIPYKLALKLKELGFDEECLATIHTKTQKIIPIYGVYKDNPRYEDFWIKAPLWQQAWEFLLSKLDANIFFWGDGVGEIGGCGNQQFFSSREESIDILIMLVESTIKK